MIEMDELRRLADLAGLQLKPKALKALRAELATLLKPLAALDAVEGELLDRPTPPHAVLDRDEPVACELASRLRGLAPQLADDLIVVPRAGASDESQAR